MSSDFSLLRRILVNMLKNALEGTSVGGVVAEKYLGGDVGFSFEGPAGRTFWVRLPAFES